MQLVCADHIGTNAGSNVMQLHNATDLELRLMVCVDRCETELPASELETSIVTCLCDAASELQRLCGIIAAVTDAARNGMASYPHNVTPAPWSHLVYVGHKSSREVWARWTDTNGIYWWLHPVDNRWVEEPEQIEMPTFTSYAAAYLAAKRSPRPPTWNDREVTL